MSWNTKPLGFGATSVSLLLLIFNPAIFSFNVYFKYRRHLDSRAHQAPSVNQALLEVLLPHQVLIC